MILSEIIEKEYADKNDLTVDLAKALEEHNALQSDYDEKVVEVERLTEEVNSLKAKNLELLSMIPIVEKVKEEEEKEIEETENITIEEILDDDLNDKDGE